MKNKKNVKLQNIGTGINTGSSVSLQSVLSSGNTNIANGSILNANSNSTLTIAGNTGAVNAVYGNGYGSNWGSTGTFTIQKTTYIILGEEFETSNSYFDASVGMAIALINVLGKPYWLELKKQNVSLGTEIDDFIEKRITILDRDKKIDDLLS